MSYTHNRQTRLPARRSGRCRGPALLALWLLLGALVPARAQRSLGIAPLDQLVQALNQQSLVPLRPYLTPETRVATLAPAYTERALARLLPLLGPVDSLQVLRQEPAGVNVRYRCALFRRGAEQPCSFVLTPAGKFAELNLGPPGRQQAASRPDTLALPAPDRVELPARLVNGLLVVQAEVDGRTGAFFFDSGAPTLLLNAREFAPPGGAGTPPAQGGQGVNGRMAGIAYYPVRRFDLRGIVLQNQEVATLDLTSLAARLGGEPLLGIIGYSVFSEYAVTLDYRAGRVLLRKSGAPGAAPVAGVRVPFALRGHLPVVAATLYGRAYALAIDCGAQTNVLDPTTGAVLAGRLRHREQVTVRGADAAGRATTTGLLPRLTLAGGQLKFTRQATTFADMGYLSRSLATVPLEGLLGYPFLSEYRTTIDYPGQQLVFEKW